MRMAGSIIAFRSKSFFFCHFHLWYLLLDFSSGTDLLLIHRGAFDISLIAAVASHLSYWADEDVSHFMISQLLSRQRIVRRASDGKS